jgi:hypothetical protein
MALREQKIRVCKLNEHEINSVNILLRYAKICAELTCSYCRI